jgi:arsenate reductase
MKKKALFLCTGNSCRSQMAEAIVNARLGNDWEAVSAGTKPAGSVHPMVREVLREIGINHIGESKSVDVYYESDFDLVITICDSAAEECPAWFEIWPTTHYNFPDPAKTGALQDFRFVRDKIAFEIPRILINY